MPVCSLQSTHSAFCCTGVISLTRMLSQWAALILWRGGQRLQSATHLAVSDMWGTCEVPPQETTVSGDPKRLKLECNTEWKYILSCIQCKHWVWPSGDFYFLYKCQDENKNEIYSYIYGQSNQIKVFLEPKMTNVVSLTGFTIHTIVTPPVPQIRSEKS